MNAHLFLFLNEEQARVGALLDVEPHLLGLLLAVEPVAAAHEEILEHDFLLRFEVIIHCDLLAGDRAEIACRTTAAVHAGSGREEDDETDNRQRDDNSPKPGLVLADCAKHISSIN